MSESFYIRCFNTVIMIVVIYAAAWMSHFFTFHQVPQQTILPIYHILQHQFYVKRYFVFPIFHQTTSFSTKKKFATTELKQCDFVKLVVLTSLALRCRNSEKKLGEYETIKKGIYINLNTLVSLKNSCMTSENIHALQTLFFSHPLDWRRSGDRTKE